MSPLLQRIVMYSGGALSWAAAMRTIERHGRDNVRLLFTDTSMEDEDLYRFLDDSERQLDIKIDRVCDGRTPWDVYRDRRMIGNTRMDPCSEHLKRKPGHKWLAENAPRSMLVFGIDWTEMHRLVPLKSRYRKMGFDVEAPMIDAPWMTKSDVLRHMKLEGLKPPRLYAMGFAHNNCGGFCCRAGQAHFATLLEVMPERYAEHEAKEAEMREYLGKDVSILRDRKSGKTRPMTLQTFRKRLQAGKEHDELDYGGCGCFVDE